MGMDETHTKKHSDLASNTIMYLYIMNNFVFIKSKKCILFTFIRIL